MFLSSFYYTNMVDIYYFICSNCYHYYQCNYLGLLLGWIKGRSKGGTKPSSRYLSIFLFIYFLARLWSQKFIEMSQYIVFFIVFTLQKML